MTIEFTGENGRETVRNDDTIASLVGSKSILLDTPVRWAAVDAEYMPASEHLATKHLISTYEGEIPSSSNAALAAMLYNEVTRRKTLLDNARRVHLPELVELISYLKEQGSKVSMQLYAPCSKDDVQVKGNLFCACLTTGDYSDDGIYRLCVEPNGAVRVSWGGCEYGFDTIGTALSEMLMEAEVRDRLAANTGNVFSI